MDVKKIQHLVSKWLLNTSFSMYWLVFSLCTSNIWSLYTKNNKFNQLFYFLVLKWEKKRGVCLLSSMERNPKYTKYKAKTRKWKWISTCRLLLARFWALVLGFLARTNCLNLALRERRWWRRNIYPQLFLFEIHLGIMPSKLFLKVISHNL